MRVLLFIILAFHLMTGVGLAGSSRSLATGQYLEVADSDSLDVNNFTVAYWWYRTGGGAFPHTFSKWTQYTCLLDDSLANERVKSSLWESAVATDYFSNDINWGNNVWGFNVCTYDGSNVNFYFNTTGDPAGIGSTANTGTIDTGTNNVRMGLYEGGGADFQFVGQLTSYHVANRAFSLVEIIEIRWKPCSIPAGLVLCNPTFGSNSPELDITGNGNTAAVTSATESSNGPPIMYGVEMPL